MQLSPLQKIGSSRLLCCLLQERICRISPVVAPECFFRSQICTLTACQSTFQPTINSTTSTAWRNDQTVQVVHRNSRGVLILLISTWYIPYINVCVLYHFMLNQNRECSQLDYKKKLSETKLESYTILGSKCIPSKRSCTTLPCGVFLLLFL